MLTSSDAAHLLRRVGFAGSAAEISHFTGMTREAAVTEVLTLDPTLPATPSFVHHNDWWVPLSDLRWWWAQRMIDARWVNRTTATPSPLVEKMTLFWHSHFATGVSKVEDLSAVFYQNQLFRNRGFGDFETLLAKATFDDTLAAGALLRYLDNDGNTKWDPQENFARELMELYTIGPDEFTESDVVNMTRAWTGHGIVGWVGHWDATYEYDADAHDNGSDKVLFGLSARNWDPAQTVDELTKGVKRDACARFLATKLWRFFINDSPPSAAIEQLVNDFNASMDISVLLEALFLRDEFWDARYQVVRSPIEFVVDLCKRCGVAAEDSNMHWMMDTMGQELFEPPGVAGWGTNGYWVSTTGIWGRTSFVSQFRYDSNVQAQFDGIMDEDNKAAGAQRVIDVLGLSNVSSQTRSALEEWWSDHENNYSWAAQTQAVVVGALTPEFLVA